MAKNSQEQVIASSESGKDKLLTLPFLILTKDLIIRPLLSQDRRIVNTAIKESLKNLKMWLPWVDEKPKLEDADKISQKFYYQAEHNQAYHFAVYKNEHFMGMCSFYDTDYRSMSTHLGYWCREEQNSGEEFLGAINAILRYGFEEAGIKEFSISCIVGNYTSELAAKQMNFKLQGIHLIKNKQIKVFKINSILQLPQIEVQWIKDPSEMVVKVSNVETQPEVTKSFLDDNF